MAYSRRSGDPWQAYITPLLEIWPTGIADEYGYQFPSFVMPFANYGNMSSFLIKEGKYSSVETLMHLVSKFIPPFETRLHTDFVL